jgi:hypothetical protein
MPMRKGDGMNQESKKQRSQGEPARTPARRSLPDFRSTIKATGKTAVYMSFGAFNLALAPQLLKLEARLLDLVEKFA